MKLMKSLLGATALVAIMAGGAIAQEPKQLVYCSEGSPEGFDPALWTAGTTFDASSRAVYSRLVDFELGGTAIVPSLAESWEVSADGTEITFKLRQDVKWQTTAYFTPTRGFNADDVLFTFDRQSDADNPWHAYLTGASYQYFGSTGFEAALKDVVKIDDYTVKFTFNKTDATVFVNFPMDFLSIVSKEYADQLAAAGKMADLNLLPVGTGPFQYVDYQVDQAIRYVANPDYWKGKEKIDSLIFQIIKEKGPAEEALKAGTCDVIPFPEPANLEALQAAGLVVTETAGLNVGYVAYNATQKPFDDPRVRRALNMAVNRDAIMDAVYAGKAALAKNPLPAVSWASDPSTPDQVYDPEGAKKLLAEAGVTDLKLKLWTLPVVRPYNPDGKKMGEMIQQDWQSVGVTTELYTMEWGAYLDASKDKNRDGAVMLGWGADNADPDNFLGVLLTCDAIPENNRAIWCNPAYDAAIAKARGTFDEAERTAAYHEAQKIFNEDAPWLLLAHANQFVAFNKRVLNFKQDPLGFHRFDGVDVE